MEGGFGGLEWIFFPSSPSFPKRGLGEILIPLASPFEKGRNYF